MKKTKSVHFVRILFVQWTYFPTLTGQQMVGWLIGKWLDLFGLLSLWTPGNIEHKNWKWNHDAKMISSEFRKSELSLFCLLSSVSIGFRCPQGPQQVETPGGLPRCPSAGLTIVAWAPQTRPVAMAEPGIILQRDEPIYPKTHLQARMWRRADRKHFPASWKAVRCGDHTIAGRSPGGSFDKPVIHFLKRSQSFFS